MRGLMRATVSVVEPQALHDAWAVVLDEHVRAFGKPQQGNAAGRLLEIKRDAALVAIDAREIDARAAGEGGDTAGKIAFARHLDLGDLGAERAEHPGAIRASQHVRKIEHPNACERSCAKRRRWCRFARYGTEVQLIHL